MGTSKSRRDEINTAIGVESKYRIIKYGIDLQHVINGLKKLKPRNDKRKINPKGMK
ncbi:MAG: hypothetical protein KBF75_09550 [Saprospiraceae bacterium]|jgi:hypothetical protein|nr:hypothetical protein [Saprospiraceae bacterium]